MQIAGQASAQAQGTFGPLPSTDREIHLATAATIGLCWLEASVSCVAAHNLNCDHISQRMLDTYKNLNDYFNDCSTDFDVLRGANLHIQPRTELSFTAEHSQACCETSPISHQCYHTLETMHGSAISADVHAHVQPMTVVPQHADAPPGLPYRTTW